MAASGSVAEVDVAASGAVADADVAAGRGGIKGDEGAKEEGKGVILERIAAGD